MFFDADENLWLYTGSQLMTFNPLENTIEVHYEVEDEESYIKKVYLDSQNNIWIEGSKDIGLLRQTKDGWEKQPSPTEYYNMHIDKNGDTYFATLENTILKYSNGIVQVVGQESWIHHFIIQRRGLLSDDKNRLWVSAAGSDSLKISLAVFENGEWKANNPPFINENERHSLETMFLDKKGRLWVQNSIISNHKIEGNALFVLENEAWFLYEDITNDHIYDYAFDRNDNLWLTTYKKGIIKLDF
jgi:ligand-binding sensor domain-containing protein